MLKLIDMSQKSSSTWLIILLCAIIIGLVLLVKNNEYSKTVNLLNEQMVKLNEEIELLKQEKQLASPVPQLEFTVLPTATPSGSPTVFPEKNNLKSATNSSERK